MAAFCVYVCGLFSTYLCKYPYSTLTRPIRIMRRKLTFNSVCPDPSIVQDGPFMVKRTKEILSECKQVWPLASRWVDSMERTYEAPQDGNVVGVSSMADGKDPVPQAWLKRSKSSPSPTQDKMMADGSTAAAKALSPRPATITSYPPSNPELQMMQPQTSPIYHQGPHTFPVAAMPQQQAPPPQPGPSPTAFNPSMHMHSLVGAGTPNAMYINSPNDGMGMMMGPYAPTQASPQQPHPQSYNLAPTGPFYPQAGPGNDGFENELQVYMGGNSHNGLPPGGWTGQF